MIRRSFAASFCLGWLAISRIGAAEPVFHGSGELAHAVSKPQSDEFGFGARIGASGELGIGSVFGIELGARSFVLGSGSAPSDARFAPKGTGIGLGGILGMHVYPLTRDKGLHLAFGGGIMGTGDVLRPMVEGTLGYDFLLSEKFRMGPALTYTQIIEDESSIRPEDARLLSGGLHVAFITDSKPPSDRDMDGIYDKVDACPDIFGVKTKDPKTNGCPRKDRDGDFIFDDEDACPDKAGVRTKDPKTNGCPRPDRDEDGIYDDEDACPDKPGIKTNDPKTNGCPRPDRDNDRVFDDEDACPDVAGVASADPKKNGCPRGDRDADGVYDDEDACPDVKGIKTDDPKTTGCPPGDGNIHVEGERIVLDDVILFDLDSPRVRHASWPAVEKVAKYIEKTGEIMEVSIEGHSDAVGSESYNLKLSLARAQAVRTLLIKFGIPEDRVKAEAFGRSRLKVQTNRAERLNRRVEIWITRTRSNAGGTP